MTKFTLPGFVWVVFILALIPPLTGIIDQFWPASDYYVTAVVIAVLAAAGKAIEVWARSNGQLPPARPPAPLPPDDGPQAAAAPTVNVYSEPGKVRRFLLG